VAAWLLVVYALATMVQLLVLGGQPATATDAFLLFLGLFGALYREDLANATLATALAFAGVTLVLATPMGLSMLPLSDQYAAATSEDARSALRIVHSSPKRRRPGVRRHAAHERLQQDDRHGPEMRMGVTSLVAGAIVVAALLCVPPSAAGQHLVEVRGADTEYRYVDWNYTWGRGAIVDLFYVGVPGSNEFNVGGGYVIKRGRLTLAPLVYAVVGKEDSPRGVKIALLASLEGGGWKMLSFLGHYIPVSGAVGAYQVMDTLDVTRTIGTRWEAGVQSGFFRAGGTWNPQVGPLVKLNDRLGAWAVSYRFGPQPEFRAGRVLTF
jgi:hypothetical protein